MAPSIATEIDIAAPPSAVWAVLEDYGRYPEWNPLVVSMSGDKKGLSILESIPESKDISILKHFSNSGR